MTELTIELDLEEPYMAMVEEIGGLDRIEEYVEEQITQGEVRGAIHSLYLREIGVGSQRGRK